MNDVDSADLLGIGDFSRFAMLSVRMLRHYDERGLLRPAYVDAGNGYRYYSPTQLKVASRIRELRDIGCGIAQIAELLPAFNDPGALQAALAEHVHTLDVAAQKIAGQRSLVFNILTRLKESSLYCSPSLVQARVPVRRFKISAGPRDSCAFVARSSALNPR